jgi:hypothetical protein
VPPTVGNAVWHHLADGDQVGGPLPTGFVGRETPFAAMVTYVWPDGSMNLVVFDPDGHIFVASQVVFVPAGETPPATARYCEWPA